MRMTVHPQVAGPYLPQFEIYWRKLDQGDTGKVAPMLAAQFLKLSGLSDQTLGKVGMSRDRSADCRTGPVRTVVTVRAVCDL